MLKFLPLAAIVLFAASPLAAAPAADGEALFRDAIAPLLADRCLECHAGADPQAGLDLSRQESLRKGSENGPVVTPKQSDNSELIARLTDGSMPPEDPLSEQEIALFRRWIELGAPWSGGSISRFGRTTKRRAGYDWWSLQPLREVKVPDTGSAAQPIDAFVQARLDAAGLHFAPPADRATLIRRLTFDLHGLPPEPAAVEAFAADESADAYEQVVERLLASPRFGEQMARRWLDVARYAESDGYEHDPRRFNAWPYRDWVIKAFNNDLPYDAFIREQLAADALHPGDKSAAAATGFVVAGPYDQVARGKIMAAEARQDELEDIVGTTTQAFLGLTAQCARCHDHKFDPILQEEYYRLTAVFAGAFHEKAGRQNGVYAIVAKSPPQVHLLKRGSVVQPGELISPAALSAVQGLAANLQAVNNGPQRRLALANWLADERNALTYRVAVNRVWSWIFGRGLVATPSDFGFQGEPPSHPDLLEWLAADFIASGKSMKGLVRQMVLSRAYRQASAWNAQAAELDGDNRLLWRYEPRRLAAEELRDSLLAISGTLNSKAGGPSYELFEATENAGTLYRSVDRAGPKYDRRSIYRRIVRGTAHPLLSSFDCPDASIPTPKRTTTTTATQALSLLHNAFVLRKAENLAQRLASESNRPSEQVELAYRLLFGRMPQPAERERAVRFVEAYDLAAYARVLFNTNEFLYVR